MEGTVAVETIEFTLNGKPVQMSVDPGRKLLWVLRTDLGLTGTKYGCGASYCGACTVLIDNEAVRSCQVAMTDVRNRNIVTIEGIGTNGKLHPLQKAFTDLDALQCGYCTPGMIMNACALLRKIPKPTYEQIIERMDNNLCRCGAHKRIVQAIQTAAQEMEKG